MWERRTIQDRSPAQVLLTPTPARPRGRLLPALSVPVEVWDGICGPGGVDPGGFPLPRHWIREEGAETPQGGVIGFGSGRGRALGGPRARPPGLVALQTLGAPSLEGRGSGSERRVAGAPRDPTDPGPSRPFGPSRPAPRSASFRLSDLNRGGRAAGPRFPSAIGCGGAVTSARSGAGGWCGRSLEGECPNGSRP